MKTTRTRGPWKVHHKRGYRYWIFGPNDEEIAILYSDDSMAKANGRLIAAAPELLEALRHDHFELFAEHIYTGGPSWTDGCATCELIAKAEGRIEQIQ